MSTARESTTRILTRDGSASSAEEALIPDARARLRPAQQVEDKLRSLLKNTPLPVSHVRLATLVNGRCHG